MGTFEYCGEALIEPPIIQGGMGVSVSSWELARSVGEEGGIGIVSGTGIGVVLARDLNRGDPGEHRRRSLADFPNQALVKQVMSKYFRQQGLDGEPFDDVPMLSAYNNSKTYAAQVVNLLGAYSEVRLASEGGVPHIGMNLLTKVAEPNLGAAYGAQLAGVEYLVMGAGLPTFMPGVLKKYSQGLPAFQRLDVKGGPDITMTFDPIDYMGKGKVPDELPIPRFFPIVSAAVLARRMMQAPLPPDGFIVEGDTAGGHNAPPRKKGVFAEDGQLLYGPKDAVSPSDFAKLGVPFYLAGGYGSPSGIERALEAGASGVQVGTAFALCTESGMAPQIRQAIIGSIIAGNDIKVYTDALASPTGYPFKVAEIPGTLGGRDESGQRPVYGQRSRICNLGYLRERYYSTKPDGSLATRSDGSLVLGYRCPSEPTEAYVRKGGDLAETVGRMCLCNGLFTTAGAGQSYENGRSEPPVVTIGDDVNRIVREIGKQDFSARDVIRYLTLSRKIFQAS